MIRGGTGRLGIRSDSKTLNFIRRPTPKHGVLDHWQAYFCRFGGSGLNPLQVVENYEVYLKHDSFRAITHAEVIKEEIPE
jgi:hypothetical protein